MWITSGGKIWICQNVRGLVSMGIIPCPHICTPTYYTLTPTFYHRFLCSDSVMTTFSPLTISGRPFFYYIHFPDKKGVSSVMGGETSKTYHLWYVTSVRRPLLPLQGGNRYVIYPPTRWIYYVPSYKDISFSGNMWDYT
jgi:hypothetical protein